MYINNRYTLECPECGGDLIDIPEGNDLEAHLECHDCGKTFDIGDPTIISHCLEGRECFGEVQ